MLCFSAGFVFRLAGKSSRDIIQMREQVVRQMELAGEKLTESGLKESWYDGAPRAVRDVAGDTNGHLLMELASAIGYVDAAAAELFREGMRDCFLRDCFSTRLRVCDLLTWLFMTQ